MKQVALLILAVALAGCAGPPVIPFDIGGSKADGTVIMGATVGAFSGPIHWEGAEGEVLKRCEAWGYSKVEAFTGIRTECLQPGTYGCLKEQQSRTYQCID